MESNDTEKLIKILSSEFIQQVSLASNHNLGIFRALKHLSIEAEIKELSLFLCISENSPIKIESLSSLLQNVISKATIYRKVPEYVEKKLLIRNDAGYLELGDSIKVLKTLSELNKKLNGD